MTKLTDGVLSALKKRRKRAPSAVLARREDLPARIPLSFAQERLWFLYQVDPTSYLVVVALLVEGPLEEEAWQAALTSTLERHEALLSTFHLDEAGQSYQAIGAPITHLERAQVGAGETLVEAAKRVAYAERERGVDLTNGPVFRSSLISKSSTEHAAVFVLHHIVSDGWSVGIFLHDFGELYGARVEQRASTLLDLPLRFVDYALWERERLEGAELVRLADFWKKTLRGAPPAIDLPTDRPRRGEEAPQVGTVALAFAPELDRSVADTARRLGATAFVVYLAGYALLLGKMARAREVVIGTQVATRGQLELEGLVGMLLNAISLRIALDPEKSFHDLVEQTKQATLDAFDHAALPFERVVAQADGIRESARHPIFQVDFAVETFSSSMHEFGPLKLRPIELGLASTAMDLSLRVGAGADGPSFHLEFNTSLFDRETALTFLGRLDEILSRAIAQHTAPLRIIALGGEAERTHAIDAFNRPLENVSANPFPARFRDAARRSPSASAVSFGERSVTFFELAERVERLSATLRTVGVRADTRVGIAIPRNVALVVAVLAVLEAGGAYVPLDPKVPPDRLRYMIEQADTAVCLFDGDGAMAASVGWQGATLVLDSDTGEATSRQEAPRSESVTIDPQSLAYVLYTSGSTGQPKGVMVHHEGLASYLDAAAALYPVGAAQFGAAVQSTFAFDLTVTSLLYPLSRGAGIVLVPDGDEVEGLANIVKRGNSFDLLKITPAHLELLSRQLDGDDMQRIGALVIGGEALSYEMLAAWREKSPRTRLFNEYGPTETVVGCSVKEVAAEGTGAVSIGTPVLGARIYVLEESIALPVGIVGELWIGGHCVTRGYVRRPDLTADRYLPDPFAAPGARMYRSGDLARWTARGELEYFGRVDHQIKLRGYRIELGEIEGVLGALEGIANSCVLLREDVPGQKELAGYFSPTPNSVRTIASILADLAERLPAYMVPTTLTELAELPLNVNGKIDRKALPRPRLGAAAIVEPRTELEAQIARAFSEVLSRPDIGVTTSFFALGGHSLRAMQLVSRLRQVLRTEISIRDIFATPTVEALASLVSRTAATVEVSIPLVPRTEGAHFVLSFAQERLYFLEQLSPGMTAYNVPSLERVRGELDEQAFGRAVAFVVERHEALRLRFSETSGEPFQEVQTDLGSTFFRAIDARLVPEADFHAMLQSELAQPFILTEAPLLRVRLYKRAPHEHVLLFVMHHLVTDGWSMGLLVRETATAYFQIARGDAPSLPPLSAQYVDYATWQRKLLSGERLARELAFWKAELSGAPKTLELTLDHPRPPRQTFVGSTARGIVSSEVAGLLRRTYPADEGTLFAVLLSAYFVLLSKHTGQRDIVIGTPIAGRAHSDTESMVGMFVSSLPIRASWGRTSSFRDLLSQVKATVVRSFEHQDVPLARIVEELAPERDASRSPIFQTMFVVENASRDLPSLEDLVFEPIAGERGAAQFELTLTCAEAADGSIGLEIEYNTDLFLRETVERLVSSFAELVHQLAAHPSLPLSSLDVRSLADRQWQASQQMGEVLDRGTSDVVDLFALHVNARPDAVAVRIGKQELSYSELDRQSDALAVTLEGSGIGLESVVAIAMDRSLDLVVAVLAVLKLGAAYVPLDPSYPRDRLSYIVEDAGSHVLLVNRVDIFDATFAPSLARVSVTDSKEKSAPARRARRAPGDAVAYIIYTSGSTGRPKGASISRDALLNHSLWFNRAFGLGPLDVVLQRTPISFDASVWEFWSALTSGARIVLAEPGRHGDPDHLHEVIDREAVTVAQMVPSLLAEFLKFVPRGPSSLRCLFCGGEALFQEHVTAFRTTFPSARLVNLYGPTEATIDVTSDECVGERVTLGRPVANMEAYVVDGELEPVPVHAAGELCVSGAQLARGYVNRGELTAERFVPNPFSTSPGTRMYRTGDLVRFLSDGRLEFLGRLGHQIKLRGFRIELGEIEATIQADPTVAAAAVLLREDVRGQPYLAAYVVQHVANGADALRASLAEKLPYFMVPTTLTVLERMPLTPNGKIDRKAFPRPDAPKELDFIGPRDEIEEKIASAFAETLGRARISVTASFFELGGHSLLAMQLVSRLRQRLERAVSLRDVFENPSIERLAHALAQGANASQTSIPRISRAETIPLSFAQERLFFIEQLAPGSGAYNIPIVLSSRGRLEVGALERAIAHACVRHEILRTRFFYDGGEAKQAVLPPKDFVASRRSARGWSTQGIRHAVSVEIARPFDLDAGHLLRLLLLEVDDDSALLVFTAHHLVSDGWSMGILVREVSQAYRASCRLSAPHEAELPIQYGDYAAWQRSEVTRPTLERDLEYWKAELLDARHVLELPLDKPRPAIVTSSGAIVSRTLPTASVEAFRMLARDENATLYMVLLAAYFALLGRVTGREDIVVGTPVAGRIRPETEPLIGMFVNTLPLRARWRRNGSFAELLGAVRERALRGFEHEEVPFAKLVDELAPQRDTSRSPLFQAVFVLQSTPQGASGASEDELTFAPYQLDAIAAQFELTLSAVEREDGTLDLHLTYNTDLFARATADLTLDRYARVLAAATQSPGAPLSRIDIAGSLERSWLLERTRRRDAFEEARTLDELFVQTAREHATRTAVSDGDGGSLTYAELDAWSSAIALALREKGVAVGDRVGIRLRRDVALVAAILGVLKAGAAYVSTDGSPRDRTREIFVDAGVRLVLSDETSREDIPEGPYERSALASRATAVHSPPSSSLGSTSERGAYVIYTSGTTGVPKGVVISHRNVVRLMLATREWFAFGPSDVSTLCHSSAFDFSVWEIWSSLLFGGRLIVVPRETARDGQAMHRLAANEKVTHLSQTPSAFRAFMEADLHSQATLSLRKVVFGGEALDPQELRGWVHRHGDAAPELINMYGITETTVHVTYRRIRREDIDGARSPIGVAIPDQAVYVLDGALEHALVGVPGELFVGGEGLATAYNARPDLTATRFVPDPFASTDGARMYRSGDLVRFTHDGELEYFGRIDQQIKLRGFRIELGEIEAAFLSTRQLTAAVALLREDVPQQKYLAAYVVWDRAASGSEDSASRIDALRALIAAKLPSYMVPTTITVLDRLPINANGKVDRRALPKPELAAQTEAVLPRNDTEAALVEIWRLVLDLKTVGVHDNFFEIGGDSIRTMKIVAEAKKRGLSLTVQDIFNRATIAELAEITTLATHEEKGSVAFSALTAEDRAALPEDLEDAYPLTDLQAGMVFHTLAGGDAMYHEVASYRLSLSFDAQAFEHALADAVKRHAILRTSFALEGYSQPLQLVHRAVTTPLEVVDRSSQNPSEAMLSASIENERHRPFVWSTPPLFRVIVHVLSPSSFHVVMSFHHAILDGWSVALLSSELLAHYRALRDDAAFALPAPASLFRDYVLLERAAVSSPEAQAFFEALFSGDAPRLLPRRHTAEIGAFERGEIHRVDREISGPLVQKLEAFARTNAVSLKSVLLAAHLVVLGALSHTDDVVTGLTTHGRVETEDGERVLGLFLNAAPIRAALSGTFGGLVARVHEAEASLLPFRRYPVSRVKQSLGREPFEALLNFVDFHVYGSGTGESAGAEQGETFGQTNQPYSLAIAKVTAAKRLTLSLAIDPAIATAEEAASILAAFERVLAAGVDGVDAPFQARAILGVDPLLDRWLADLEEQALLVRDRAFWKRELSGASLVLDLPTDRARTVPYGRATAEQTAVLPSELARAISEFSSRLAGDINATILAAFAVFLSLQTNRRDIIVGAFSPNRAAALPLRLHWSRQTTFEHLVLELSRVRERASLHENVSLEEIATLLSSTGDASRPPIVQAAFAAEVEGDTPRSFDVFGFDLTLVRRSVAGRTVLALHHHSGLFESVTAHRHLEAFLQTLDWCVRHPADSLDTVRALPDQQRSLLLRQWNDTVAPRSASFVELFRAVVAEHPDAIAVSDRERSYKYSELSILAENVAVRLQAQGVTHECRVGLAMDRRAEMLVAILGIHLAGGAWVPLDPLAPQDRLRWMAEDAQIVLVVRSDRDAQPAPEIGVPAVTIESLMHVAQTHGARTASLRNSRSASYVIYTSGSTGKPKGAIVEDEGMVNHLFAKAEAFSTTKVDVVAQTASHCFDISVWQFLVALTVGARTHVIDDETVRNADGLLSELDRERVTVFEPVPSLLRVIVESISERYPLPNLRWVIPTGEALPLELAKDWTRLRPGIPLVNAYGPTECSDDVTHYFVPPDLDAARMPIGNPILNTSMYVLDDRMELAPIGATGDLVVGGIGVGRGYVGRADLTAEQFIPDAFAENGRRMYRTGDIARWNHRGELEYLGRIGQQIKLRGFRIELGEIESAIQAEPNVASAAVVLREDTPGSKYIAGYVALESSFEAPHFAVDTLRAALSSKLPSYMVPSTITVLASLPLSANGKVDRKLLPRPEAPVEVENIQPRTAEEHAVAEVFAELLGVSSPSVTASFFELGGHSLLAMRLVSRLRQRLDRSVTLKEVFEHPSIESLARILSAGARAMYEAIPKLAPHEPKVPSFAQERLLFLEELSPMNTAYNLPLVLRVEGELDLERFGDALKSVVARHESLRMRFPSAAGEPQVIVDPIPDSVLTVVDASRSSADAVQALVTRELALPFDLSKGPLLRVLVFRKTARESVLVATLHHIISDAWSMGILVRELGAAYRTPSVTSLPTLPIQYSDYAAWQRRAFIGERLGAELAFWKRELEGAPFVLELPTDLPRPAVATHAGATISASIEPAVAARLRAFALARGATLFSTLLSAYGVLLSSRSQQRDIVVGTPVAARVHPDTETLIGMFVNTLPLRIRVQHAATFETLVDAVQAMTLRTFEHQELPLAKLVETLAPERDPSRSPLFQTMFVLQNAPTEEVQFAAGLSFAPLPLGRASAPYEITLSCAEAIDGSIDVTLETNTDLYERESAARWLAEFVSSCSDLVDHARSRLDTRNVGASDRDGTQARSLREQVPALPWSGGVLSLFNAAVERSPEAIALEFEGRRISYAELDEKSSRVASALRAVIRIAEPVIGLHLERSAELIVAMLGIWKAGGAYLPLDTRSPVERSKNLLRGVAADVVLVDAHLSSDRKESLERDFVLLAVEDSLRAKPLEASRVRTHAEQLAYVIYTSGSTGTPKGVGVSHRALAQQVSWTNEAFPLRADDVFLQRTQETFDPSLLEIFTTLSQGAKLVIVPRDLLADGAAIVRAVRESGVTMMHSVPSLWRMLLAVPGIETCATLRCVFCGGEAMALDLVEDFRSKIPSARFFNVYGPTEMTIVSTYKELTHEIRSVSIGRAVGDVTTRVVDASLQDVPHGAIGELLLGGAQLARGYLGHPSLTAQSFVPDSDSSLGTRAYRTGDLVRRNNQDELEFIGRRDQQIKLRGFRIELGEIENALNEEPAVKSSAVLLREDVPGQKYVAAYFVTEGEELTASSLRARLAAKLPSYMIPTTFTLLERMPLNANEKIDRAALPRPVLEEQDAYVAPRSALEHELASLWSEFLAVEKVGVRTSFFDLGGSSLSALRLLTMIESKTGKRVPLARLFGEPTIESLAREIETSGAGNPWVVPLQSRGSRTPLVFFPALSGDPRHLGVFAKHLGDDQPIFGLYATWRDGDDAPPVALDEMARIYLRELRTVQPKGPYRLAGFSAGCSLALVAAQQLLDDGEEVLPPILIDGSFPGERVPLASTDRAIEWLEKHLETSAATTLGDLKAHVEDDEVIDYIATLGLGIGASGEAKAHLDHADLRLLRVCRAVWHSIGEADFDRRLPIGATLVASRTLDSAIVAAWKTAFTNLSVHTIDCTHAEIVFEEPFIGEVAAIIRAALGR